MCTREHLYFVFIALLPGTVLSIVVELKKMSHKLHKAHLHRLCAILISICLM